MVYQPPEIFVPSLLCF